MPNLINVSITESAFYYKNDITVIGGVHSNHLSQLDIGALLFVVPFPSNDYCTSILEGSNEATDLMIGSYVCSFESVTAFDLSIYPKLKTIRIGDNGFDYVEELKLIGMSELESVEIGMNSFTKEKYGNDPNRHFYLKNCPKLKSLKMGRYSFSDYSVIEIENVNALEVIEIGHLNELSYNFRYASLELKSILIHRE